MGWGGQTAFTFYVCGLTTACPLSPFTSPSYSPRACVVTPPPARTIRVEKFGDELDDGRGLRVLVGKVEGEIERSSFPCCFVRPVAQASEAVAGLGARRAVKECEEGAEHVCVRDGRE